MNAHLPSNLVYGSQYFSAVRKDWYIRCARFDRMYVGVGVLCCVWVEGWANRPLHRLSLDWIYWILILIDGWEGLEYFFSNCKGMPYLAGYWRDLRVCDNIVAGGWFSKVGVWLRGWAEFRPGVMFGEDFYLRISTCFHLLRGVRLCSRATEAASCWKENKFVCSLMFCVLLKHADVELGLSHGFFSFLQTCMLLYYLFHVWKNIHPV